jgi:predicted MFS family arabinose efflux permease
VLAPALGPTIGGVLVEAFGWRSIFFVVLPFCLAALGLARSTLPAVDPGAAALQRGAARLDVVGLGWVVAAVLSLLNGLVHLHAGERGIALGLLVCSAVTTALFVRRQRRQARPLMELRLYSHRNFAMGGVVSFVYGTALFGSTYLVPVFMQIALGLPPSQAGAVLLPAGLVLAVTIPLAGRLADRLPVAKLVSAGLLLMALSFALMLTVGAGTALGVIALWAIVGRIGLGFVMPSLNLGAMRGLPMDLIAQGSSNISFLRQLGGAVGVSLTGSVLEWRLQSLPGAPLTAFHQTFALLAAVTAAAMVAAWHMAPRGSAARAA